MEFEARVEACDTSLFAYVPSQTSEADRESLLRLHGAACRAYGEFRYLEIGSHLGGSLQVLIADRRCTGITSIDPAHQCRPMR